VKSSKNWVLENNPYKKEVRKCLLFNLKIEEFKI
jgi:hypothetical protein